jgi:hypothetical protein
MNKSGVRIRDGIRSLVSRPFEIISGTVVEGSTDLSAYTVSVLPSDGVVPIEGVMLNSTAADQNGMIMIPKEGSNVVIGSVDGPGEWVLLRAGELAGIRVKIENVNVSIDEANVSIANGSMVFNISDSVFRINSASENLFQLLKDCFTYIAALTVPTPAGTSSVPVNVADFNNLISRLDNLLTS